MTTTTRPQTPKLVRGLPPLKQVNIYDGGTGKLISTSTSKRANLLGFGWAMVDKKRLATVSRRLNTAALRLLINLVSRQNYGEYVRCSRSTLANDLGVHVNTINRALNTLTANDYIARLTVDGQQVILLNPNFTCCGRSTVPVRRRLWDQYKAMAPLGTLASQYKVEGGDIVAENDQLRDDVQP